jgi:hypothetical protein
MRAASAAGGMMEADGGLVLFGLATVRVALGKSVVLRRVAAVLESSLGGDRCARMEDPMKTRIVVLAIAALGIAIGVNAQQAGSGRGILQISSASMEGRDIVTAMHVYRGAVTEPRHTHPGDVSGFILEGNVTVVREDQPSISLMASQNLFRALWRGSQHHQCRRRPNRGDLFRGKGQASHGWCEPPTRGRKAALSS